LSTRGQSPCSATRRPALARQIMDVRRRPITLKLLSPRLAAMDPDSLRRPRLEVAGPALTEAVPRSRQFCMTAVFHRPCRIAGHLLRVDFRSPGAVNVRFPADYAPSTWAHYRPETLDGVDACVHAAAEYARNRPRAGGPPAPANRLLPPSSAPRVDEPDHADRAGELFGPSATFEVFDPEPTRCAGLCHVTEYPCLAASIWSRYIDRPLLCGRLQLCAALRLLWTQPCPLRRRSVRV